jgi:hypothetical protein
VEALKKKTIYSFFLQNDDEGTSLPLIY